MNTTDKTLFLAWQDRARSHRWYPVGRLDARLSDSYFRFRYTHGAEQAREGSGFQPLYSFPAFDRAYESGELFPLFKNRVLSAERADFGEYLVHLGLTPDSGDPIEILSVDGGYRATDSLEVFPKVERHADGGFRCRFFLHGWRHVTQPAQERISQLRLGEQLVAAIEINNPATMLAVQVLTMDYHMIGWTPRYLVSDLIKAIAQAPSKMEAKVLRINPAPAPSKQRVLIEFRGHWPEGYEPMSGEEFQPLVG
jgi:hypothetical protein